MSVLFATQLTAVATAALAVLALAAAILASLAFWKQSQEVAILLKQSERDAADRRKAQAAQIFIATPPDPEQPAIPYAHNASSLPVYEAKFWYRGQYGASAASDLGTIKPGEAKGPNLRYTDEYALANTILKFRDAAGVHWTRMPDGTLIEQAPGSANARLPVRSVASRPRKPQ
jgi:hypothetical protein